MQCIGCWLLTVLCCSLERLCLNVQVTADDGRCRFPLQCPGHCCSCGAGIGLDSDTVALLYSTNTQTYGFVTKCLVVSLQAIGIREAIYGCIICDGGDDSILVLNLTGQNMVGCPSMVAMVTRFI